jgi:hypothetical protein
MCDLRIPEDTDLTFNGHRTGETMTTNLELTDRAPGFLVAASTEDSQGCAESLSEVTVRFEEGPESQGCS